jgi:hypothetical protein
MFAGLYNMALPKPMNAMLLQVIGIRSVPRSAVAWFQTLGCNVNNPGISAEQIAKSL